MERHVHDAFLALVTDAERRDVVSQDGYVINLCEDPSEELQLAAVMEAGRAI